MGVWLQQTLDNTNLYFDFLWPGFSTRVMRPTLTPVRHLAIFRGTASAHQIKFFAEKYFEKKIESKI